MPVLLGRLGDEQIARISRLMEKHPPPDLKETDGLNRHGSLARRGRTRALPMKMF